MFMAEEIIRIKSTKELLLDAAFSFCDDSGMGIFSLNDLAQKVGISKAAIYRHFASKDDVFDAMRMHFFDMLGDYLLQIAAQSDIKSGKASRVPFTNLIEFFADNPFYVNYMVGCLCRESNFDQVIREEMQKRGVKNLDSYFNMSSDGKLVITDFNHFTQALYCGITMFYFLKVRHKMLTIGNKECSAKDFSDKLVTFILHGLRGTTTGDSLLCPSNLTDRRLDELDKICSIDASQYPNEDRIFTALAKVINQYGLGGVTIERIATELNLAKSSLYEYFDNKQHMIKTLILKEFALLNVIVVENSSEAKNLTEYMYISQRTVLEYMLIKPSILPICGWLLTFDMRESMPELDIPNPWTEKLPKLLKEPDLGLLLNSKQFMLWISSVPAALVLQCTHHGVVGEDLKKILRQIFKYIINGISKYNC